MTRNMLIDTDTASDDAVALLMALEHPDIDVLAITTVAGNVSLAQASINARYTVEFCGHDTPVYEGAERPLLRAPHRAEFFHGSDGMGDMHYPAPRRAPQPQHAVAAIIDTVRANPGIILVTLGPLTNIALALQQAPDIAGNVSRCVVMGGAACCIGNITPAAEFNIWCDPEAARICLHAGLPIELVCWENCRGAASLTPTELQQLTAEIGTAKTQFLIDCNRVATKVNCEWLGEPGLTLPDPVAMAVAIEPDICRASQHYVDIECQGELTRGMTVVDQLNTVAHGVAQNQANVAAWQALVQRGQANARVCWEVDANRWKALLHQCLR
ncbi:MAG: nucleoside hydrolase [Gammaproteobacteria bacterium]|jgi:purine nucleosidase|nr:nucleoside hydrolase [Gammaproteobacteria bacterium]